MKLFTVNSNYLPLIENPLVNFNILSLILTVNLRISLKIINGQ